MAHPAEHSEPYEETVLGTEAKRLGLDPSNHYEGGLAAEVGRRWREENAAAIASSNAWVERHGLPLDRFRMF